jgi:DNA-binding NarL/FixJ family response regulator
VVLMDLGLPGMSGIEATQRIKSRYPQTKVIIYSSHDQEREVTAALGAGANAYCVKDSPASNLVETVKMVAEGAAWLDPAIADIALKIFQHSYKPTDTSVDPEPKRPEATPSPQLTEREMEVLKLLVEGKSNTEIAKSLIISVHTAKTHVCNILQKLAVHDRVQAAVKAIQSGLV